MYFKVLTTTATIHLTQYQTINSFQNEFHRNWSSPTNAILIIRLSNLSEPCKSRIFQLIDFANWVYLYVLLITYRIYNSISRLIFKISLSNLLWNLEKGKKKFIDRGRAYFIKDPKILFIECKCKLKNVYVYILQLFLSFVNALYIIFQHIFQCLERILQWNQVWYSKIEYVWIYSKKKFPRILRLKNFNQKSIL